MACNHNYTSVHLKSLSVLLGLVVVVVLSLLSQRCHGLGSFGLDIHHRFSDPVTEILGIDELPHKGTPQYYASMVHRDRVFRGRRLAGNQHTPVTFAAGNDTQQIAAFGYLHFANVSVGTPPLWFMVALDTGSDLFWLPCNCTSCVRGLKTQSGKVIDLNIYELDKSSTRKNVPCQSSLCNTQKQCPSSGSNCRYEVEYLSNDTSSTGFLVEDVLHLITDNDQAKDVDSQITIGCGQVQTGVFLNGAAPNGLFGLGMDNISVPSILAQKGLILDSFSMCFGSDGSGRITFGDTGGSDLGKTPFNLRESHPTYNVTVTQIIVGGNADDLEFHAIFDSGTSFTYLNDPAYTLITEKFNSLIKADRHSSLSADSDLPFEYCYDVSPDQSVEVPYLNLTMKGGDDYYVMSPILPVSGDVERSVLCLGIQKSGDVNIIGQNFMTGYRIVFDRENMYLGWKESNCTDEVFSNTLPLNPSPAISPAMAVNPVATSSNSGKSSPNSSFRMKPIFAYMVIFFTLIAIF